MTPNFSNIFKWSLAQTIIGAGLVKSAIKRAMNGDHILAVYFHDPSRKEFESAVKWLLKNEFQFISPEDLLMIAQNKQPFPKGAIMITVDDGWKNNEENIVEVANTYKIPVCIFVATEAIETGNYWWPKVIYANKTLQKDIPDVQDLKKVSNEKRLEIINKIKTTDKNGREAMDIKQIIRISKSPYVHIGAHTHTHPILPNCSYEQSLEELKSSKEKLESWIGKPVISFAYPNGDFTNREINLLSQLNYQLAFTCEPTGIKRQNLLSPYKIPRFAFLEGASMAENICRMVGIWQPLRDQFRYTLFHQKAEYSEYKFQKQS
ncbi:polysaccharide deacetylase family protein [Echinicola marina]|uniref:polysaccharide deacetylase family protein n=1 Tax=Echinicola marina TaxID=2859768 RepID=UPI001CF674BE|nr:polysaccharide deacetylase family protein [Echinicola marina]UCS92971.1 polysaccharide deacetylase family protein [Echinicola marina]